MKNEMLVLGLTGPTGAGKGEVAALLREADVPVIDTDALSREVTAAGHSCLAELAAAFSPDILRSDGSLNRAALAAAAFSSPENTVRLNAIVHPYVITLTNERLAEYAAAGCRLAAVDAPLLFESGMDAVCHRTAAVLAPAEVRLARIKMRDGISDKQAMARMNAQPNDQYYEERVSDVLRNDGTLLEFRVTVREWIARLKEYV